MTIFKYAALRGLRNYLSFVLNFVLPIGLIFVRPVWTGPFPMGPYYMAMVLMYGSFLMARGILNDRIDGTIVRILAGPVTTLHYLKQNLLACLLPLFTQICIVCAVGYGLYDWSLTITFSLLLCYALFAAASVAFSFAWSCLFKNKESSYAVFSIVMSIVAMLAGFWYPLDIMPNALHYAGALFPAYWTSNAIFTLFENGPSGEYWLSLAAVTFFAIAYLLYGGKRKIT